MTDLAKQIIETVKEKALSSISQYRTDIMMKMIQLHIENDNKDFIGIPHAQESNIYDEMDESLKYIDRLAENIKMMELEEIT